MKSYIALFLVVLAILFPPFSDRSDRGAFKISFAPLWDNRIDPPDPAIQWPILGAELVFCFMLFKKLETDDQRRINAELCENMIKGSRQIQDNLSKYPQETSADLDETTAKRLEKYSSKIQPEEESD